MASERITSVLIVFRDSVNGDDIGNAVETIVSNPHVESAHLSTAGTEATIAAFEAHQRIEQMVRDAVEATQDDPRLMP